jgi:arginyl-tRNA--protein-N-Asp/Glu arginylyltransferase
MALVAGSIRVPRPATGMTAFTIKVPTWIVHKIAYKVVCTAVSDLLEKGKSTVYLVKIFYHVLFFRPDYRGALCDN